METRARGLFKTRFGKERRSGERRGYTNYNYIST